MQRGGRRRTRYGAVAADEGRTARRRGGAAGQIPFNYNCSTLLDRRCSFVRIHTLSP